MIDSPLRRVVIVGASLAGLRAAEALRREGYDGTLTIVGAEAHLPYDRPPLSKQVLAGTMDPEKTALRLDDDLDIQWLLSTRATGLDLHRHTVTTSEAGAIDFDGLVIATGAQVRTLPNLADLEGVHVLRTLDDALSLRARFEEHPRVAVIGAGFIGAEVAATAQALGLQVAVIEALPVPLARAIGEQMGRRCAQLHADHGVDLHLGNAVSNLEGSAMVEAVRLADGTRIPADVVVVGVGVSPTTAWLESSGVDLGDGVICDQWCRVLVGGKPQPGIVAAGDVARWHHPGYGTTIRVEHWTNASEQGQAAARSLLKGEEAPPFAPVPYFWSDQYKTKIQFCGRVEAGDEIAVIDGSLDDAKWVAGYGRAGRLVAALAFSRPARLMAMLTLIEQGSPWPLVPTA